MAPRVIGIISSRDDFANKALTEGRGRLYRDNHRLRRGHNSIWGVQGADQNIDIPVHRRDLPKVNEDISYLRFDKLQVICEFFY